MENRNRPFSNMKSENWKNLLLFAIICFYIILFFSFSKNGARGSDYELYWATGKIADTKGYSEIYNVSEIRSVYRQIVDVSGNHVYNEEFIEGIFPVAYFSVFFIVFQFFSRMTLESGFLIWTLLNLSILLGYLFFFLNNVDSEKRINKLGLKLLLPFLVSYPVFFNIMCGQVEVFILICTGEFLRNAINKNLTLSGFWLGGLLLKPQMLILILPIFFIMRYRKALYGFLFSCGLLLGTSLLLSGLNGVGALLNLWTKYSHSIPDDALQIMINWRMIGANTNILLNTSFGWVITLLGVIFTILSTILLIKKTHLYGTASWVLNIAAIFTATLLVTWHSLSHMAMVLIPFLVYALVNNLLPKEKVFIWCLTSPVLYLLIITVGVILFSILKHTPSFHLNNVVAFTGFASNIYLLFSILRSPDIWNSSQVMGISQQSQNLDSE